MGAVIYGLVPYLDETAVPEIPNAVSLTYGALHRTAWALAVSWVIFACIRGYGGTSTLKVFIYLWTRMIIMHNDIRCLRCSVPIMEGFHAIRSLDLLRLPHSLGLYQRLLRRAQEAGLLHFHGAVEHLLWHSANFLCARLCRLLDH